MNSQNLVSNGSSQGPTCKKIQNYIFKFSDLLGQGNFSKVYKAHHEITGKITFYVFLDEIVAIKIVELNSLKSKKLQQLLFSQINILKKLNHPNILRCFEVFTSNRNCYIITQLCNQGDLESKLRKKKCFSEFDAQPIIRDLFQGLFYLAEQNVIHRDLKVANVFIHNGKAKLADFGFSKYTKTKFKDISIGSPIYMSPQGFNQNIYGPKTDIWAFGVLIYELLHGETPYNLCKTESQLKNQLMIPLSPNRIRSDISSDLKEVILKCMQVNEDKRVTTFQLGNLPYFERILKKPSNILKVYPDKTRQVGFESRSRLPSFQNKINQSVTFQIQNNTVKHRKMSIQKIPRQNHFVTGNQGNSFEKSKGQISGYHKAQNQNFISTKNFDTLGSIKPSENSQYRPRDRGITTDKRSHKVKSIEKRQGLKLISNSRLPKVISTKPTFKQTVNLLHYARLIFKFVCFLREQQNWVQNYLNEIHILTKWLFIILDQTSEKIQAKEIFYEQSSNAQIREKKLIQVTAEYQKKYRKQLQSQLIEVNRMEKYSLIDLDYMKKFLYDQYLRYDKNLVSSSEISKSILYFGHNIMMIYDATRLIEKCYAEKNYAFFQNYRDIQIFLSKNKDTMDMEGYQQKRKGMAIYA